MKKILFILTLPLTLFSSVEHKDEFIDVYLSNISNNLGEKTEILKYVLNNLNGTFLDIGTGGDAIAVLAENIPQDSRPTLIAADIDPCVIESIKKRRKDIVKYLNKKEGPKVELITMSAVNMDLIKDSSLAGIGASALAHEIFSYIPSRGPLDQFTAEICRVLEKDGVFIYRDPKWVDDPQTQCTMIIKKNVAKYYTTLFLTRFLDRQFTLIKDYKDDCCKPSIYSPDQLKVNAYLKTCKQFKQFSFLEFLNIPSCQIDYSKNFSIEAPKGLIAEIQRHYLMFIKNYFASEFLDERFFKKDLNLESLSNEERDLLVEFAQKKKLPLSENIIKQKDFPLYFKEGEKLEALFATELEIDLEDKKDLVSYLQEFASSDINRNLFFLKDEKTLLIDPKILTLLFHGKNEGIFKFLSRDVNVPWDILEHLKLEGEEHYFYKTKDQLITYFGQFSRFILKDGHKKGYILAPIKEEEVKEVPRDFYKYILRRDMFVLNAHGDVHEPITEKNIIHFSLQPEEKAFAIYNQLIDSNPDLYQDLAKWVLHVGKRNN